MQTWCGVLEARAWLALVHQVGVHAGPSIGVLQDGLEDRLEIRERFDLRHEVHKVGIFLCNKKLMLEFDDW